MSQHQLSLEAKEQHYKSFVEAADPLIKWLNQNAHPHQSVILTCTGAELVEGVMSYSTEQFLND